MSGDKIGGEYGEIRANIDIQSLNKYLGQHGRGIRVPVEVKQFKFEKYGQSNPTYFLTDKSGTRFVMRKKPGGQLLSPTAHAVEREYKILQAIHTHNTRNKPKAYIPIPQPILLCEDSSVIGTPFYVMEFLDGRIFSDPRMLEIPKEDRKQCWLSAVGSLAALSSLVPSEVGLENFGPHTPYFPRQIKSLSKVSQAQAKVVDMETKQPVGPVPDYDEMIAWYREHLPDESKTGLRVVHGDYKIDNLVFHPTEPRVIGILDWELCTLGSPVTGRSRQSFMPYHVDPAEVPPPSAISGFKGQPPDAVPCSLEELERTFFDGFGVPYPITEMVFANSWMMFRLSIISQGIAARYAQRQASSANAKAQGDRFPMLGRMAKRLMLEGSFENPKAKL
ncbi:Phosphotransferase enzyme family [Rhizoctonia solani]|uniref:Phosphotransferase enzyme family n=1 Tax=Rhizoctonia solani TaxID=456999 RepID=A0A8H7M5W1_9AGAM|nr:Phosphotransferase enzyme family [Rhizoctonia solani]